MTLEDIKHDSLEQVAWKYREGYISENTAAQYVQLWNTTAFRFTEAYLASGVILQRERDNDK